MTKYNPGYGRSYTPPSQEIRDLFATMKLIPIKEIICCNRIILGEDSMFRGTESKNYSLKNLWDNKAKEVHVRPACPPRMFPCKFALSTRSTAELAARRAIRSIEGKDIEDFSEYLDPNSSQYTRMVEWILREMGATTIKYQTTDDRIQGLVLSRKKLRLHSWLGSRNGIGRKGHIAGNATVWYTYPDFSVKSFPMVDGLGPSPWNGQKDGKPLPKNRNRFTSGHHWRRSCRQSLCPLSAALCR